MRMRGHKFKPFNAIQSFTKSNQRKTKTEGKIKTKTRRPIQKKSEETSFFSLSRSVSLHFGSFDIRIRVLHCAFSMYGCGIFVFILATHRTYNKNQIDQKPLRSFWHGPLNMMGKKNGEKKVPKF